MQHARAAERLRQENDLRMAPLHLRDHPLPERERLRMGIVDTEDRYALADPELEHAFELPPQRLPLVGFEIERDDVLVLLRRVLRVLDAPVGPPPKPTRMSADIGVIGRALERDVERDLEPEAASLGRELAKILERAERRMNVLVTALLRADRPRRARIVRAGHERVVRALPLRSADRMDRRQIDDVEAEAGDVRQTLARALERAVTLAVFGRRAREELVPRREARALAVDDDGEHLVVERLE